jgi:hypothetical protein
MTRPAKKRHAVASLLAASLLLSGCASAPRPDADLAAAEAALSNARRVGASEVAPLEFASAQQKLGQARAAADERQYERARQSAAQAQVDAELAAAKSRAAQARDEVKRKAEANATLRRDLLGEEGAR